MINGEEEFLKEREARRQVLNFLSDEVLEFIFPGDEKSYVSQINSVSLFPKSYSYILWNVSQIPVLSKDSSTIIVSSLGKTLKSSVASLVFNFPKLKTNDVVDWITEEGRFRKIDLERVAGALFVNHGTCLRKIASEIEKLSVISDFDNFPIISPEEAKSIMCVSAEINPSMIIDFISVGKSSNIILVLNRLQSNISYVISYVFKHLFEVFESEVFGSPVNVKMKNFMGKWKVVSLQKAIKILRDLDVAQRRGDPSVPFRLEFELLRLSEEVKNGGTSVCTG